MATANLQRTIDAAWPPDVSAPDARSLDEVVWPRRFGFGPIWTASKRPAQAHGFTPVWSGASYVNHSADAAARCEAVTDAQQSLNDLRCGLIATGLANDDEINAAIAAWDAWGHDPDSMYLGCRCECVARKG